MPRLTGELTTPAGPQTPTRRRSSRTERQKRRLRLKALDQRVARDGTTREEIVSQALDEPLYKERREAEEEDAHRRWLEDAHRRDVEGYTRFPQTPDEFDWSDVIKEEEEGKPGLGW